MVKADLKKEIAARNAGPPKRTKTSCPPRITVTRAAPETAAKTAGELRADLVADDAARARC